MAEHRVITYDGIRVPTADGKSEVLMTWEQLRGLNPADTATVLGKAGLSQDEQTSLMDKINNAARLTGSTANSDISSFLNDTAGTEIADIPWLHPKSEWQKLGLSQLSDTLMAEYQKRAAGTGAQQNLSAITGQSANQQQQPTDTTVGPPGLTEANLKAYTNDYLLPALNSVRTAQDQDLMQWKSFLNQQQGLHPSNPIAQILQQQFNAQAPLYDTMMNQAQFQMLSQPYLDQNNAYLGAVAAQGQRELSQSASIQAYLPYLAQLPGGLQQFGTPTSGGTIPGSGAIGAGTGGINSLPLSSYGIGAINTQPGG